MTHLEQLASLRRDRDAVILALGAPGVDDLAAWCADYRRRREDEAAELRRLRQALCLRSE